ncbi:unnamed protein product [Lactuca saligna]|uniref:Uncharacterized protein n=1 Tax=Lactuca saligna TaxID=75948 RepID=A0AA36ELS0_LACSI|nr:unnamed protein product [Lactuca saligna]
MEAGIQPHVTLNHIDLPLILEDEYGGWLSRKSVKDFVAFADVCFREFGDRVLHWTTFNEANLYALGGYDTGSSPPGRCSSPFRMINCSRGDSTYEPYLVAHHFLLAHASTVRLYWGKYKVKLWPLPLYSSFLVHAIYGNLFTTMELDGRRS